MWKNILSEISKMSLSDAFEISKLSLTNLIFCMHTKNMKNDKNYRTEFQQYAINSDTRPAPARWGEVFKILRLVFKPLSLLWTSLKTEESRVGPDFPSLLWSHLLFICLAWDSCFISLIDVMSPYSYLGLLSLYEGCFPLHIFISTLVFLYKWWAL